VREEGAGTHGSTRGKIVRRLRRLDGAEERLDAPHHDEATLSRSLDQVAAVNRWLGGRRALLGHLGPWIAGGAREILDVGTGSGDLPKAMEAWAKRKHHPVRLTLVDAHPQIAALAASRTGLSTTVADGIRLPFEDGTFDVALLSMTLHHSEGLLQVRMLEELRRVARRHVLVGELHRTWPNYLGARLLAATLWRFNSLTRHDGPISVLRSFTPQELSDLATRAGLFRPRVYRHFFYRLVLTAEVEGS
jgi:SAM-dependent methyltransferase